mmetsp:Transcript_7621/g.14927  ORF Transcript_7621/g.14927 Transcript_7621/m.14927 type:complete len:443 (-) Transcript_7621:165-1493(-)|eukprot:CAMPEP_0170179526 /NCGR_PEP_ID=MMETSP0040_2-20121228/18170_1 /TAXON_ID=641309 /ORGANISM="Lotharella oceanica, Strain CCMP622" /LENGTH=442 /DNA_ID=CAMNT_0010423687 /DNA_START=12 /DNA_END=1340 /DNA_ORIENTATION=+
MVSRAELKDVVVVGGGHAGVNLGCWLAEMKGGPSYVVLEKGRLLSKWRDNRWVGFKLNTPMKYSRLHGQKDDIADEKMGRPIAEDIRRWDGHIKKMALKYREFCLVESVTLAPTDKDLFTVRAKSEDGGPKEYIARNVVVCCGEYDRVKVPVNLSSALDPSIQQFTSDQFHSSKNLEDGGVLLVGSGQSGVQIARILSGEGRDVYLATSRVRGSVRTYRHEDVFFWLDRVGIMHMLSEELHKLPKDVSHKIRYGKLPITGPDEAISLFSLHRSGVKLLGSVSSVGPDGCILKLKPNRADNVKHSWEQYQMLPKRIESWIKEQPQKVQAGFKPADDFPEPEWKVVPKLLKDNGASTLCLKESKIRNIIWATGYSADLSFLKIPGVKEDFEPIRNLPSSLSSKAHPGLFYSGFPWIHHQQSQNLVGFDKDHALIAEQIRKRCAQ